HSSRCGLADAISHKQFLIKRYSAAMLRNNGASPRRRTAGLHIVVRQENFSFVTGLQGIMENLSGYAHRPIPFVLRYIRKRMAAHLVIFVAVVSAVACSVGTQYGVKHLVDSFSAGPSHRHGVWLG